LGYEERISFQDFHRMWSLSTKVKDRRTDDMHSQYRALHYSASSQGKNAVFTLCRNTVGDIVDTVVATDNDSVSPGRRRRRVEGSHIPGWRIWSAPAPQPIKSVRDCRT